MGDGDQTIVKADPKTGVQFQLVMTDYDVHLDGQLSFEPAGQATKVTWTDQGSLGHSPLQRLMGPMMDSMMGKTFEASLGKFKERWWRRLKRPPRKRHRPSPSLERHC